MTDDNPDEIEATLAGGGKGTFIPSQEGNSCSFGDCDSEYVRVKELDPPERMYCHKHCTSKKRDRDRDRNAF